MTSLNLSKWKTRKTKEKEVETMKRILDRNLAHRNVILDISSDITVLGMLLAMTQVFIYRSFTYQQCLVLIIFLALSSIWKLVSPFSESAQHDWARYLQGVLLVISTITLLLILTFI